MRAMVMAAGAGTRLRPLTFAVPKPMVPVANRPVLEYTLLNLKRHGITEIMLNLHAFPKMIRDYFQDGSRWGVKLHYSYEPKLLGTAGGVKNVEAFLKDSPFLVMSGDGLTDIDLTAFIAFHRKKRAYASLALKPIDSRFDYGVTFMNATGRVQRFVEKPSWSDVFSNLVNAGIYIFEPDVFRLMPKNRFYDFGKQLWPKLLKLRKPIYGYVTPSYWCDIGNLHEYRRSQRDMLEHHLHFSLPGHIRKPEVRIGERTKIHASVKLQAPCLIGDDGVIGAGTTIGAYTVIGHRAKIGRNAKINNCVLWDNVTVENGVALENCIISVNAHVRENIYVYEGTVLEVSG